ncbi:MULTISPECIES: hypothetical protein [Haloferax]|uniref:Uncharacterized protein n=1 Tax=Haloferax marinum TaxID=2666143 RepID=A0A6A8G4A8_9EURY|nr:MULTISPECIES: hypothetical protein [Haloferax]KAB1196436.1 hypothetical protein Hfx1150_02440 [Haloferax sp. CBA1150]MRW95432.1 hypothetical protein [Haloferax marinum]
MSPTRAFWLSFAVYGLAATVSVGLDIASGTAGIGTVAALFGILVVGYASMTALRHPDRVNIPTDWGPLVYLVAAGVAVFLASVALQVYTVVL